MTVLKKLSPVTFYLEKKKRITNPFNLVNNSYDKVVMKKVLGQFMVFEHGTF